MLLKEKTFMIILALIIPVFTLQAQQKPWFGKYGPTTRPEEQQHEKQMIKKMGINIHSITLNDDNSFTMKYRGDTLKGTYSVSGIVLTLNVTDVNGDKPDEDHSWDKVYKFRDDYRVLEIDSKRGDIWVKKTGQP